MESSQSCGETIENGRIRTLKIAYQGRGKHKGIGKWVGEQASGEDGKVGGIFQN
jgi:hypothetical protein